MQAKVALAVAGQRPTLRVGNALLLAYREAGEWQRALALVASMPVDRVAIATVLRGGAPWEVCLALVALVPEDSVAVHCAMEALVASGHPALAHALAAPCHDAAVHRFAAHARGLAQQDPALRTEPGGS